MDKKGKSLQIITNWKKICNYIKKNYQFEDGIRFGWFHDAYYWLDIAVNPQGECFLFFGSHGSNHAEEIITDDCEVFLGTNARFQSCSPTFFEDEKITKEQVIERGLNYAPTSGRVRRLDEVEKAILAWHKTIKPRLEEAKQNEESLYTFEP